MIPLPDDPRRRRILFRATHRGTQENDLLLGTFVRRHVASLTGAQLDALEKIMDLPEPVLADILTGRAPFPTALDATLLGAIRDHVRTGAISA